MKSAFLLSIPVFLLPAIAFADTPATYTLMAPLTGALTGSPDLSHYLQGVVQLTIGIAGVLAVIMMVYCGIQLMGTPSASGKSAAKECVWNAIFGVLLAIGAWVLLNTINPLLLSNELNLGNVTVTGVGTGSGGTMAPQGTTYNWCDPAVSSCGHVQGKIVAALPPSYCGGTAPSAGSTCYGSVDSPLRSPTGTRVTAESPITGPAASFPSPAGTTAGTRSPTQTANQNANSGTTAVILPQTQTVNQSAHFSAHVETTVVVSVTNMPSPVLDAIRPTVTILSPESDLVTTSATIPVTFTASDDKSLARLEYIYTPPGKTARTTTICAGSCGSPPAVPAGTVSPNTDFAHYGFYYSGYSASSNDLADLATYTHTVFANTVEQVQLDMSYGFSDIIYEFRFEEILTQLLVNEGITTTGNPLATYDFRTINGYETKALELYRQRLILLKDELLSAGVFGNVDIFYLSDEPALHRNYIPSQSFLDKIEGTFKSVFPGKKSSMAFAEDRASTNPFRGAHLSPPLTLDIVTVDPYFWDNSVGCSETDIRNNLYVTNANSTINWAIPFGKPIIVAWDAMLRNGIDPRQCYITGVYNILKNDNRIIGLMWFSYDRSAHDGTLTGAANSSTLITMIKNFTAGVSVPISPSVTMTVPVAIDLGFFGTQTIEIRACDAQQCGWKTITVVTEKPCVSTATMICKGELPNGRTTAWPMCIPPSGILGNHGILVGYNTNAYQFKITSADGGGIIHVASGDQYEFPVPLGGPANGSGAPTCNDCSVDMTWLSCGEDCSYPYYFLRYLLNPTDWSHSPPACFTGCSLDADTGAWSCPPRSNNLIVSISSVPDDLSSTPTTVSLAHKRLSGYCGNSGAGLMPDFSVTISTNQSADKKTTCILQPNRTYYLNISTPPGVDQSGNGNTAYSIFRNWAP